MTRAISCLSFTRYFFRRSLSRPCLLPSTQASSESFGSAGCGLRYQRHCELLTNYELGNLLRTNCGLGDKVVRTSDCALFACRSSQGSVPNPQLVRSRFPNPQLVSDAQCRWYRSPQLTLSLARGSTPHYYSEGYNRTRGDLRQLAATLNKPLKRSPGAYARAFLSIARNRATGELKEYDQQADPIALPG